jgi:hypothetical protein
MPDIYFKKNHKLLGNAIRVVGLSGVRQVSDSRRLASRFVRTFHRVASYGRAAL